MPRTLWDRSRIIETPTTKLKLEGQEIWYDSTLFDTFEPRLFDPGWLAENGLIHGGSRGRGEAYFLRHSGRDMVLRHFRRGGLIGRINRDLYLGARVAKSRAMQEFSLLQSMLAAGLNVARPVAARCIHLGPFYRADLITLRIPDALPLADILKTRKLGDAVWQAIGTEIRRMHDLNVHHADLNCRNILLDDNETPWLIDFDKSGKRAPGDWTRANLARLRRSFDKEKSLHHDLNFQESDWMALETGYGDAPA